MGETIRIDYSLGFAIPKTSECNHKESLEDGFQCGWCGFTDKVKPIPTNKQLDNEVRTLSEDRREID